MAVFLYVYLAEGSQLGNCLALRFGSFYLLGLWTFWMYSPPEEHIWGRHRPSARIFLLCDGKVRAFEARAGNKLTMGLISYYRGIACGLYVPETT